MVWVCVCVHKVIIATEGLISLFLTLFLQVCCSVQQYQALHAGGNGQT